MAKNEASKEQENHPDESIDAKWQAELRAFKRDAATEKEIAAFDAIRRKDAHIKYIVKAIESGAFGGLDEMAKALKPKRSLCADPKNNWADWVKFAKTGAKKPRKPRTKAEDDATPAINSPGPMLGNAAMRAIYDALRAQVIAEIEKISFDAADPLGRAKNEIVKDAINKLRS